tara:strand:+ start:59 stop:1138 length:1080 start_codon:yes stop_codon:yes gene_type:complete
MSGTLICGKTTGNAVVPLQVNADGTLEMTAEIDSSALAKESTLDSFRTENATNLGALALALDDGTQVARCMGSEDPNDPAGTQKQLHVDGSGNVQTNVVNTVNINPANTVNSGITNDPANSVAVGLRARTDIADAATETFLKSDASGNLQVDVNNTANVKFEDISSSLNSGTANDPANSLAVGLRARQTITDSSTETFLKCDASGVLEVSSSGGGSANTNLYPTLNSITTATTFAGGMVESNYLNLENAKNVVINCIHTGDATARSNFASDIDLSVEFTDDNTNTVCYSGASSPVNALPTIKADGSTTGSAVAVLSFGENSEASGQITGKFLRVVAINNNVSTSATAFAINFKVVVSGI